MARQGFELLTDLNPYQKSIIQSRAVKFKNLVRIRKELDRALRTAAGRLNGEILGMEGADGTIQRSILAAKARAISELVDDLSLDLRQNIISVMGDTSGEVAAIRELSLNRYIQDDTPANLQVNFTDIPVDVVNSLIQRGDKEGLMWSPRIWAQEQKNTIMGELSAAQLGGEDARTVARRLRIHMLGTGDLTEAELRDLRKVKGVERRKLGTSIRAKAERLSFSEIANASWETHRRVAMKSPVVGSVLWTLSARHPKWDVCDILATQDVYGLGAGTYPPALIPPRPHPYCLCYMQDNIRDPKEWNKRKTAPPIQEDPEEATKNLAGFGSDRYVQRQKELYRDLVRATEETRPQVVRTARTKPPPPPGAAGTPTVPIQMLRQPAPTDAYLNNVKTMVQAGINTADEAIELGELLGDRIDTRVRENARRLRDRQRLLERQEQWLGGYLQELSLTLDPALEGTARATMFREAIRKQPARPGRLTPRIKLQDIPESMTLQQSADLSQRLLDQMTDIQTERFSVVKARGTNRMDATRSVIAEARPVGPKVVDGVPQNIKARPINEGPLNTILWDTQAERAIYAGRQQEVIDALTEVSQDLPTEWIERQRTGDPLSASMTRRGFHSSAGNMIAVSDRNQTDQLKPGLPVSRPSAMHELGHVLEDLYPQVVDMEREFYQRRTQGEALQTAPGYAAKEKFRRDKFADIYMGKDYKGTAYELFSMGLEGVYYNSHLLFEQDREMYNWVLGIIASL